MRRFIVQIKYFLQGLSGLSQGFTRAATSERKLDKLNERATGYKKAPSESEAYPLFRDIGIALTAWSKMEERLVVVVALLLRTGAEESGLLMYSILNFYSWLSIIHDLMVITKSPHQRKWNKISERIKRKKDIRDQIAHHPVGISDCGPIISSSILDVRFKTKKMASLTHMELNEFTYTIHDVIHDIDRLIDLMISERQAWLAEHSKPNSDHPPESGSQ